ncbi:hypothetical protein DW018_03445 [Eubacterium ventriosum]|uniref:Cohesin domain-containing protein n=1 Tax=Eubacterium ventriosum TaxID=39496 RepID=A0A415LFV7_9FIRM|nr:cohesin domain-containing protein [Eubacterium ventriosum]RHL47184.1 hypothetical protein DW018_03445 [Eubacterium ventriosum]
MKIKNKFYHFIVSIILVVSLLAGTIVPANTIVKADDNNPTIWTSYEQSNGVVTIHYYGTGITNLSSYQMLIKYDNEKLSYKECKFSSELGSTITSAKESQGTVKIALINGNGLSVSDKELFAITYTADFVGSEQCVFNTNINEAYDRNLSNIDFNIDSQLTINVNNPLSDNYQVNLEGTTDANANDTVQCRFGFSRNAGVMSGSFILHYNEEQVRFQKVTANKNVEGLIVSYNKLEEGTVKVAYAFNKCSTTTMKFLNMEFIPLEKSTYSYISLTDVVVTNEQLQECVFEGSYKTSISTLDSQSDNLFTVNGPDSIDSQETFDVTIDLAGNSGIAAMTASLEYDSDIFEIQSSSFSESILKNSFTNASTSNKGKVKFAFMSTDDIKADGQVIKLTFKAIKNENVSGKFQLVVDELTDSNATKQEYNIADLTTKVNKICIHNYIGPDFQWSDDYSTCKAVYTCEYNREHVIKVDCDVETTRTEATCEEDGNITHTATGIYNDQKITDVQKETIPAKGHVKGEVKIENATESTCEKGGSYDEVVYCTVCNKELSRNTVKTEALGHKWNEGKITTQPTCMEEGVKTFECMVCGKTKTEKVEALGHDWNNDFTVDKEATCEETGLKSIHCKRCDIKKDETVIPAKGHVAGEKKIENATEAVCEAGGSYDEVIYCTVCNKELSRTTVKTEAKGHKWNEGKITTQPTCTEEGVKTFQCMVCGKTKTEKASALGHDWNEDFTVDKEATCEETGLKSIHCKHCDEKKDETTIPAKGHVEGEVKIENATEATCEQGGSYDEVVYCTVCNKELSRNTVKTEAKGHKWNPGTITTEPTCTEEGVKTFECTVCGKTKTEKVEALGHDWNEDFTVDKEATCEETGLKSIHCKRCDSKKDETVIPAKGHVAGEKKIENATEAVCEVGGSYDEVVYCTVCGKELSRTTVKTEAKGHKWNPGTITTEPTCTEEGVKTFECTVCGKTKTEKVEALGHDWDNDFTVDKEETCEETGVKSIHCKRCDERKEITTIPAKGHVAGEKKIENATESTCENGGSYDEVIYCTVCGKELSRTTIKTEAKGHVKGEVKIENATESTCEEGGSYDEVVYCTVCNKELSRNTVKTEALGHKWNEGKITTQPTCTEEGVKTFQCMVCGKTKTEAVAALGHNWNKDFTVDKEATCEETGLKSIHCKRCDERKEITTIPAKGHVKGKVKIENATEATCEEGGNYDEVVYCTVCNKELSRTTVKTEAKGHKWNEGKITTEPTCTEEGVKTFQCMVCGKTKTEAVAALDHNWNEDFTVDKESTCEETGLKSIHCKRCDEKKDETTIPAKGHVKGKVKIENATEATCEVGGTYDEVIYCTVCNKELSRTTVKTEAKGHVKGEVKIENATESTCEKGGSYDEVIYCTVCNKELSRTTVKTEAKGHKWNEGKITTQPTCTEEGVKTFECMVCGKTKTEKVSALGHDWAEDFTVDKEATCEETGLKSIHCKHCDEKKDETTIPAKGHVKGKVKIENATEATCEEGGSYDEVVYCTVCNKELSRTTVKTEAKGHKWNKGKVTTEPTYAEEGVKTYTCTACGATKTEVIPKRNMEYTVGSTYQDISTNAIYRITVINKQVEYVCPIDKKLKKATIPSQIRIGNVTYKVTSIGNNAFKRCKNLSSITIGNNISKIGNKAFYNCKKLKKIKIKSKKLTLKKIGKSAFKKINKKAKISVPKSKKKSYKKMLTKKGLSKTVKIK